MSKTTVDIRPTVSYLSILPSINYRAWYALAEFVDNSIQSYINNKRILKKNNPKHKLKISIYVSKNKIRILDNAAGIGKEDFNRAFRAAARPDNKKGLSEFGMGMKTAACWFSPEWKVVTKPLGENEIKTVKFDIKKIVKDEIEELDVSTSKSNLREHYTEITLYNLRKQPQGSTVKKMKDLIASIYRAYLKTGEVEIKYNDENLRYKMPNVLVAPYFEDVDLKQNPKKLNGLKK